MNILIENASFNSALKFLKEGKKISRKNWNGKEMYLYLVEQELNCPPLPETEGWKSGIFGISKFIVMRTADKKLIPWLASQTDLLSDDWVIYDK